MALALGAMGDWLAVGSTVQVWSFALCFLSFINPS
jgi:hypothetical protein